MPTTANSSTEPVVNTIWSLEEKIFSLIVKEPDLLKKVITKTLINHHSKELQNSQTMYGIFFANLGSIISV